MFNRSRGLDCPTTFPFPFTPYTIQDEFMRALYSVIENRKIGIFESPTGTGKTLTLMCSTLKWLIDDDQLKREDIREQIALLQAEVADSERANATATDWLDGQFDALQKKGDLVKMKNQLDAMEAHDRKVSETRTKWQQQQQQLKNGGRRELAKRKRSAEDLLEELDADGKQKVQGSDDEFAIDDSDDDDEAEPDAGNEENRYLDNKIFFCSRTHSQLAQVVHELKRTDYGKSVRIVSLASRQQYCINPSVRALKTNALINERCLELKKGKSKSKCCAAEGKQCDRDGRATKKSKVVKNRAESCPFYAQAAIDSVKQAALYHSNGVLDIEELIEEAKSEKGCPYYASRQAAKDAQVIMLPYQMLLHKKTREQLDIDISNSVIIIDEAHNLLDTIASIHSAEITLDQLQQSHRQLVAYKAAYLARFSTKNLLRLNQLISIANRFVRFLAQPIPVKPSGNQTEFSSQLAFVHELLDDANISVSNLFEILMFCENTRLAQKVGGFTLRYANDASVLIKNEEQKQKPKRTPATYLKRLAEKQQSKKSAATATGANTPRASEESNVENIPSLGSASALRILLAFLDCLLEKSTDGRILITRHRTLQSKSVLKYLLLNPSGPFDELLRECRALIVAGGTMQPTTEFKTQLFGEFSARIEEHFFGHVVAAEAVLPMVVAKGPRGSPFLFNFTNRNNTDMLADLSMVLQNICNVVPAGIVCFFTSYDYMDQVYKYLCNTNALEKIQTKKKVFKEARIGGQTEKMLNDFANAIRNCRKSMVDGPTGALMMSVIGGKLSEGLNFSDDLGRCVCVVGLPFPNRTNPELAEKMKYLDEVAAKQTKNGQSGSYSSTEYYENLCMKAVNQCIGRAIRHINDYASVLLIDERYGSMRIQNKLPEWIRKSLKCPQNFGGVQGALVKFFRGKPNKVAT